jgi:hypothetical protein
VRAVDRVRRFDCGAQLRAVGRCPSRFRVRRDQPGAGSLLSRSRGGQTRAAYEVEHETLTGVALECVSRLVFGCHSIQPAGRGEWLLVNRRACRVGGITRRHLICGLRLVVALRGCAIRIGLRGHPRHALRFHRRGAGAADRGVLHRGDAVGSGSGAHRSEDQGAAGTAVGNGQQLVPPDGRRCHCNRVSRPLTPKPTERPRRRSPGNRNP